MSDDKTTASAAAEKKLPSTARNVCELFRLLAGHEILGLAPGEIAKGLDVQAAWVSNTLPALAAETGFVELVPGTNRWRLGVPFVRIATTVAAALNDARRRLDDVSARYSTPL